ncbi:MAG TPA: hypothetical protein VKB36_00735 [Vicinamibacterales bacterium]|nr:hypothetical protein [Vicinamibacterales bacterium]
MHRTRLVRVSFVLLFTAAFVSSAAAQPGLLRTLDVAIIDSGLATAIDHLSDEGATHVANVVSFMNGRKDALVVWNTR